MQIKTPHSHQQTGLKTGNEAEGLEPIRDFSIPVHLENQFGGFF